MPHRLPVASTRPAWLRFGIVLPLLGAASALTAAIPAVTERTPFMFFYAVVAAASVFGRLGPALFATGASAAIVELLFLDHGTAVPLHLTNDLGFLAVCGVIIALAERSTRLARAERAEREWSDVVLRSIGDAVIVTDADGRVLMMNAVAAEMTGWAEIEALQQPVGKVFRVVHQLTGAAVENPIDRVFREGKVVGLANHSVLIARDGCETPIDDSGAPIWSEDGRVVGAVLVFRDIAERYQAERQRAALLESEQAARAEAQAANRAKDEFLAVLSHELRTPLNAVMGWSQVIRNSPLLPEVARGVEVIERNARRQAQLIEDVLDVSRIVSGRLSLESAPVEIQEIVDAAVDAFRPLIEAKGLRLSVRGSCGGTVLGDVQRLQQVIGNLLSNAVKFTPAGGSIEIGMERQAPHCAISVRDTGVGIAPGFLPLVFERFRQQDSGSARRFGGLGLGLAIVRHLVEMHGGSVSVESEGPDRGSLFTVRLPLANHAAFAERARPAPSAPPGNRLAGVRVLAVDDEPDARDFVSAALRAAGAEVRVAGSADEAMRVLAEFTPEVLVADLEMPGDDGYALLRRIRENGYGPPAIAVTAHSTNEHRRHALAAGFFQHVSKPVDTAELQLIVAKAAADARRAVRD